MIDAGLVHVSTEPTREFAASIVDRDGYVLRMIGVLSLPEGSVYRKSSVARRVTRDWNAPPVRWNGGVLPCGKALALYGCDGRYFINTPIDGFVEHWPRPETELIPLTVYSGTNSDPRNDDAAIRIVAEAMAKVVEYIDDQEKHVVESRVHLSFRWPKSPSHKQHEYELRKVTYSDGSVAGNLVLMTGKAETIDCVSFGMNRRILDLWASPLITGDDVMRYFGILEVTPHYMGAKVQRREPVVPATIGRLWGELLAIVNSVTPLSPDVLREAVMHPGKWFAPLMEQAGPLIPKRLRRDLRYSGNDVLEMSEWPKKFSGDEQADAWSGWYWFNREYFD